MWISELSERTAQPVDTIKHYLRIGVLPKGRSLGPLRAEYDESHVSRLALIKALHEVGRLSLDQIRRVFDSVDGNRTSLRDAVGRSHLMLSVDFAEAHVPSPTSVAVVDRMIEQHGWTIRDDSAHRTALAVAIDTLCEVYPDDQRDMPLLSHLLDLYADHAELVAGDELTHVDTTTLETTLNSIVIGTVLFEPLILIIRRLAHEQVSLSWAAEASWQELRGELDAHDQRDDPAEPAGSHRIPEVEHASLPPAAAGS